MTKDQKGSFYNGHHAELYDIFYADKSYIKEAAFVHDCLQKYGNPNPKHILELACGTGSHSLCLEKYGYDIIATDYSEDMLIEAKKKAAAVKSKVSFRRQDMCALEISEGPFDAVFCLFDSIGYVATNDNIQKALEGVRCHLKKGGLFVFEFWHAGAMISGYDPLRVRRWKVPTGEVLRISETKIDLASQLCHVTYSIYDLNENGTYHQMQETHTNRFFLLQEMEKFLSNAGFIALKWFSGFEENETIDKDTWHVVGVARLLDQGEKSQ